MTSGPSNLQNLQNKLLELETMAADRARDELHHCD